MICVGCVRLGPRKFEHMTRSGIDRSTRSRNTRIRHSIAAVSRPGNTVRIQSAYWSSRRSFGLLGPGRRSQQRRVTTTARSTPVPYIDTPSPPGSPKSIEAASSHLSIMPLDRFRPARPLNLASKTVGPFSASASARFFALQLPRVFICHRSALRRVEAYPPVRRRWCVCCTWGWHRNALTDTGHVIRTQVS